MQKQAPTVGRLLTMVLFALSCFGLLLFLWLSFGGATPLKPKGYRFEVAMPEATQLGLEADVRISGVSVGNVRKKELDPDGNRTLATVEIDPEYAPIPSDSRAILRQKTLLGETYIELTPGSKGAKPIPEGGRLDNSAVEDSVQLDEIFQALDPQTREAFRVWQQELGTAVEGRGRDLNDALGNLPDFVADAGDVLDVLDTQERAVQQLVKNTGVVFGALSENQQQLTNLVTGSARTFEATASQNEALAEAFQIFPTFLDESKATMTRLQRFSRNAKPLMADLKLAGRDLAPALRDTRRLAPELVNLFDRLDPLIDVSEEGLPALRDILRDAIPLFGNLSPFLSQLNPILQWLEAHQYTVSDFITNGTVALADRTVSVAGKRGHYLRQFGPIGAESVAIWPFRLPSNRGNSYIPPLGLSPDFLGIKEIFPNFDCDNAGGEVGRSEGTGPPLYLGGAPACAILPPITFNGVQQGKFPHVDPQSYETPASQTP